jgi:hypothetical protein
MAQETPREPPTGLSLIWILEIHDSKWGCRGPSRVSAGMH